MAKRPKYGDNFSCSADFLPPVKQMKQAKPLLAYGEESRSFAYLDELFTAY